MSFFLHHDYRELLRQALLQKKAAFGRAFTFEKLAKACKVQRPYLSTVLGGQGDLNADQVFLAACFLEFTEIEQRYVGLLNEWTRSACSQRRTKLQQDLAVVREEALQTEAYLKEAGPATPNEEQLRKFYLDFNAQLVHMFLTIPRFHSDPIKIQKALCLEDEMWNQAVAKIEQAGLIRRTGKKIDVLVDSFHLAASSPLYPNYRMQMRLRALQHMEVRPTDEHYSFSVLFSGDESDRQQLRARFLEFISWAQGLTQGKPVSEVFQLNFDLLKWS